MDSRAKQRLTGAVILVALFVLLVPELLTGPRSTGGDAPGEEGMRRYTIDLDAPAGGAATAAHAEPERAVSLPPVAENSASNSNVSGARAIPGEAAQPDSAAPATPAATPTPMPAAAPIATPMASPPQTVATNPAATSPKPTATPPAVRAETPRPAAAQEQVGRGGFAVQLGSFVSRDNAERLVREMNSKGFNAFLAPPITTGGRALYRVRVGPTRDRASAEALAAQLRRIGQVGSIVAIS